MSWLRGGGDAGPQPGWVKAPPAVEGEIRTVWQEDEMPEELTSSPGYVPFTLGQDAQAWVDSMAEVVDGGTAVFGRPKPATPKPHRQLATPPPTTSQPPTPRDPAPLPRPTYPTRIVGVPAPQKPAEMPEIGPPEPRLVSRPGIPMPDIGSAGPVATPKPAAAMPEIVTPRTRTLPRRVLMPEIGEEEQQQPLMPEIGEG